MSLMRKFACCERPSGEKPLPLCALRAREHVSPPERRASSTPHVRDRIPQPLARGGHRGRFFKKPDQRDLARAAAAEEAWRALRRSVRSAGSDRGRR